MKRIKSEEIQETIRSYLKQRNISTKVNNQRNYQTNLLDCNQIVANDFALVEASINDYYAYCLNSVSVETDYFKEFETLKNFTEKSEPNFTKLVYPILVYICIDLISLGHSIKEKINKLFEHVNDEDIKALIGDLILFEQSEGLEKSNKLNELVENKWRIHLNPTEWRTFISFLINFKCYLLLRIVNLNLQIVKLDHNESSNSVDFEESSLLVCESTELHKMNLPVDTKDIINNNSNSGYKRPNSRCNDNNVNLKSLKDCIQMIRSKPATINGTCCFYLNDPHGKITSATLSPDYRYASFTCEDSSIYLHDLQSSSSSSHSSSVKLTGAHSNTVLKSRFTHDSSYLVSGDFDGTASLWRVNSSKLGSSEHVTSYSGHLYPVWDVDVFSSLNLFATCSKDSTARLWSFDRLYPLRVYAGHLADVNSVRFHPNASYMATASSDKSVRLWSVQTCEFVRLFSGHRSRVFALAFSPDGNYLASAGEDRKIKVWDLRMGSMLKELRGHNNFIHTLVYDNHSQVLCSGGLDKTVKFWDLSQTKSSSSSPPQQQSKTSAQQQSTELITSSPIDFDVYWSSVDVNNVFYLAGARKKPSMDAHEDVTPSVKSEKVEQNKTEVERNSSPASAMTTGQQKAADRPPPPPPPQPPVTRRTGVSTRKASAAAANSKNVQTPTSTNASTPTTSNKSNYNFLNNDDLYEV